MTNLCDDGHNWNLGDEWKILGDTSAILPNGIQWMNNYGIN